MPAPFRFWQIKTRTWSKPVKPH